MVAPALIGAAGSILGGLFGRSKQISAGDNAYSHVSGIMRAAKKFGFNPLTLLGSVGQMGGTPADNSAFGQGIANAALLASDAIAAKRETAGRLNQYQMQNQRLQSKLNAITLRPPVPGVYGGAPMPSDPEVYGAPNAETSSGVLPRGAGPAGGPFPIREKDAGFLADPRREYKNEPVSTHSGTIVIDNPALPLPAKVITLDGDEPLHWYEYPSLIQPALTMGIDMMSTFAPTMNGNFDGVDPDRWMYLKARKRPYERMGRDGALPLRSNEQGFKF